MKAKIISAAIATAIISSCNMDLNDSGNGAIRISFSKDYAFLTKAQQSLIPDTNAFILKVYDSSGRSVYDGKYGDAPATIITDPGNYTIDAYSMEFKEPCFDSPQYGDSRTISVSAGQTTAVTMECTQLNAGIRLKTHSDFLTSYPNGVLYLKSAEGRLMYSYSEKRTAFFRPGTVSLLLADSGKEETLFTRNLSAREILTVNISSGTTSGTKGGVRLQIDTCREWIYENFTIGGGNDAGDIRNALSIDEAKSHIGETDVWVYGYIVGGDLSSSRCSFQAPFTARTNLVLAAKSSCRDKEACLSVKLSQGDIRDALNLVDHPDNIGKQVYVKGDIISSYYGIPGVQGLSEYRWK